MKSVRFSRNEIPSPRPILGAAVVAPEFKMFFDYHYLYEAKILRPGRHVPEHLLYEGRDKVWVRSISASDAELAFRISARKTNGRETVTDILQFEKMVWWPIELPHAPGRVVTIDRLRAVLSDPNAHFLGIFPSEECRFAHTALEEDREIRDILVNTRENVLHTAKRKLHQNILLCDGIAYSRGGAPLRIQDPTGGAQFINPGASRAVDLLQEGLFHLSEPLMREELQSIFRAGTMMPAHQITESADRTVRPHIELFDLAFETGGVIDHRVDACFRAVIRELRAGKAAFMAIAEKLTGTVTPIQDDFQILEASFSASSANSHRGGDNALTSVRAVDLKNFVELVEYTQFDFGCLELVKEARRTVTAAIAAGYDLSVKLEKVDEDFILGLLDPRNSPPRGNRGPPPQDPAC
jgi:hypothetical protein